ncbi:MAG TPA: tetratricopeptide repeat protein [Allosphingosinicella sp.]|nr:tetratricopeptide repeat protein [Allosphingosinicella sp.]
MASRAAARTLALAVAALGAAALPAEGTADSTLRAPLLPDESCLPVDAEALQAAPRQGAPVLVEGLGFAGLEPDTDDAQARAWFAQGVRLVWAFDEAEAIRAFQEAQRRDPNCALCFFGEAWARGPTINLQPRTDELAAARAAARRAVALSQRLGARDRILVRGMEIRTRDGPAFANAAYASFMETAALRMPGDDTLSIMAADARMVVSENMRPGSLSQRLLERVLVRNPDHGGAIHYYIHLTDWIDRQHLAVPHAERLGRIAPAASHLVHMPSHSFYGVGRYRDAAAVNVAAIAADRAFVRRVAPPPTDYRTGLLAHNMHFAIESALARGDGATALDVSRQYRDEYLGRDASAFRRFLGSATWYSLGLHGPVAEVLAIAEPDQALDKAMRHYARGEALARRGDAAGVRAEAAAIARLREGSDAPALGRGGTPLAEVVQHVLEGRAAMLAGDHEAAQRAYRKAMERQLRTRFGNDPPVFWYSVRRSLAAALLAGGDPRGARAQLHASLRRWPNDPLALYALAQADRALGETESAERNLARARAVWAGDLSEMSLTRI